MLDDKTVDALLPEIYTRLGAMPEEWSYEIVGPHPDCTLEISGGGNSTNFNLTPVAAIDGERKSGPPMTFTQFISGTREIAGIVVPDTKVVCVNKPELNLYDWLRSDPWEAIG